MRLRELLARPALRLRLLHGDAEALERPLRWVYTTDLLDPSRYLTGGELVVSGMVWRSGPADSEVFVAALARSGAAALAAGEAVFGGVPDDVLDACRRHGVPLLAVPEQVSFGAVTEVVVGQAGAARGDRLALSLGRQRRLLNAVAGGLGLDELAGQVSADAGRTCRVLTTTGRVVAGPALAVDERDGLVAAFLTGASARAGRLLAPIGTPGEPRLTQWFAVVDPPPAGSGPSGTATAEPADPGPADPDPADTDPADTDPADAITELCAFAALDRARRDEGRRTGLGLADDAVALLVGGAPRAETAARLRQTGLDPARPHVVVVARLAGAHPPGAVRALLAEAVATAAEPPSRSDGPTTAASADAARSSTADAGGRNDAHVAAWQTAVALHDGDAVALLAGTAGAGVAGVLTALRRLAPGLAAGRAGTGPGAGLAVGVGRPSDLHALAGAVQEARHACDLAARRAERVAVVTAAELTSHVGLLAAVPDDVRRAFAERALGPLLAHDARAGTGLLPTLQAFLDCDGSWSRAAARLHLHVNSVRYRIARVEQLTGRDLGTLADRTDLLLALTIRGR